MDNRSKDQNVEPCYCARCEGKLPTPCRYGAPIIGRLMAFYSVSTLEELVLAQDRHIERLQAKLPPTRDEQPRKVREG